MLFRSVSQSRYNAIETQTPYFLRCNGAEVSIEMYSDLYGVIGDTFSTLISPGFGLPHLRQFNYNESTSLTGTWYSQNTLPATRNSGQTLVTKNRVYLIGGSSSSTNAGSQSTIYTATINTKTGSIGSWVSSGNIPVKLDSFGIAVYLNRVYLIGGNTNGTITNSIYSCLIDEEGLLGEWSLIGTLPFELKNTSVIITKNILTCIGGEHTSGIVINVIQSKINTDGTLGTWYSCPNLPNARTSVCVLPVKGWVYLIGGNSRSSAVSTVFRSIINPDGIS